MIHLKILIKINKIFTTNIKILYVYLFFNIDAFDIINI